MSTWTSQEREWMVVALVQLKNCVESGRKSNNELKSSNSMLKVKKCYVKQKWQAWEARDFSEVFLMVKGEKHEEERYRQEGGRKTQH